MKFANTKINLIKYLDYKKVNKKKFYELTGIKRGFLDTDKLEITVTDENLAKIIAVFKDLNLYWLISERGEMLNEEGVKAIKSPDTKMGDLEGRIDTLFHSVSDIFKKSSLNSQRIEELFNSIKKVKNS